MLALLGTRPAGGFFPLLWAVALLPVAVARSDQADERPESGAADVADRALALERRVLDYYRSLSSGEATLTVEVSREDVRRWKLWFKGDRLRMEQFESRYERPKQIVRADGRIFHRGFGTRPATGESVLGLPEIHSEDWTGTSLFDLRKLAVVAAPPGILRALDSWERPLGDAQRIRERIEQENVEGHVLTRIDMRAGDGNTTTIWIDEHRGPSLVRYKHTADVRGKTYVDLQNNELEHYDGVWFPRRLVHQRFVNGRPLRAQVTTLTDVRFNHPIDDSLFTFASVGVKPGDLVNVYTEGSPPPVMYWDGEQLQPAASRRPQAVNPLPDRASQPPFEGLVGWRRWVMILNGGAALVCVVFFLRRRSSSSAKITN